METQTALLRRQLQQIDDAERYKRNQRLVYGDRTKKVRKRNSTKAIPKPSRQRRTQPDDTVYRSLGPKVANKLINDVRRGKITRAGAITRYERMGGRPAYMRGMLNKAGIYPAVK